MKTTVAAIIAAASFSLLTAQVSAETLSNQEWVASQYFTGPGTSVQRAIPQLEKQFDAEEWATSQHFSGPRKAAKSTRDFTVTEGAVDWVASQHNSGPRIEYR